MKKNFLNWFLAGLGLFLICSTVVAQPTSLSAREVREIVTLVRNDVLKKAPGVAPILVVDPKTLVQVDNYVFIQWYENAGGFYGLRKERTRWKITCAFGGVVYADEMVKYCQIPQSTATKLAAELSKILK